MMRRALITGITGFIGGTLAARLLTDGWKVDAIVRPQSNIDSLAFGPDTTFHVVEDGQDLTATLAAARPDVVFHLASLYLAEHRPDQIAALVQSNILFPTLLAEAMVATGVRRLVNTGTAWQNFRGENYLPVNLYAATKQAAEHLLLYYTDACDLSVITLRLFDTYGHGDKRRKLIQILIDAAQSGENIAMSPGDQLVDLTHVDDVVQGFMTAAERLFNAPQSVSELYLLSGERFSVKELAKVVGDATGNPLTPNFGGRPYRSREVMKPIDAGGRLLPDWQPRHILAEYLASYRG
jgi:nucleoside-diphosphate-sugar epimerase